MAQAVIIEEPRLTQIVFGSTRLAWLWLILRLWLGWEWLHAGWRKVFGGNITWKVWNWGDPEFSLTGTGNCGWVRSCTLDDGTVVEAGDSVAGFATRAIQSAEGPHPDVAYSWYVNFLEWIRDSAHVWLGPLVAVGELLIGVALILGAFTGIAAFLGATLNFSFVFAGVSGVNPGMILVSLVLILAWRVAGWYGLDRWLLPILGVPWSADVDIGDQADPDG
jgi:thiosulfate dehydrogenase [quinone] large subunit